MFRTAQDRNVIGLNSSHSRSWTRMISWPPDCNWCTYQGFSTHLAAWEFDSGLFLFRRAFVYARNCHECLFHSGSWKGDCVPQCNFWFYFCEYCSHLILVDFCTPNRIFRISLLCLKQNSRQLSTKGRKACGCLSEKCRPSKSSIRNLYTNLM